MKSSELLPCPFCGGEARYNTVSSAAVVECTECFAAIVRPVEKCESAIAAWNTRAETRAERDLRDEVNWLHSELHGAEMEAKKLLELLQDVAICACGRYCHGCPHQYDGCDRDERLRELGVEVD